LNVARKETKSTMRTATSVPATPNRIRRKLLIAGAALAAIAGSGLVAACGEDPKLPAGPSGPSFVAVTITGGPSTLAPGQSAQYTASVRLSDGTVQTATQAGVRWLPGNLMVLRADASGRVTALEKLGDTTLTAAVGDRDVRTEIRSTMEITVVPEGTYRVVGQVTEAESPSLGIFGARVAVTPGALVTATDSAGRYKLYGVPADANIRVTAEGYLPYERPVRLTGHATEDVPLTLSGSRLTIDGPYTLAIDVVNTCTGLSQDLLHRSYQAVVTQTGPVVEVLLTEPRFRLNETGRGNRFTGRVAGTVASFTLSSFDPESYAVVGPTDYPNVVERLASGSLLVVQGTAVATASAGGLSGTLTGQLAGWGPGFPTDLDFQGLCRSDRFTLTPR
jgi:hypothetical protein